MKRRTIVEYYFILYMLIYLAWPSWQGERFLVPVIPFIFYYILRTAELILRALFFLIARRHTALKDRFWIVRGAALVILAVSLIKLNWASDVNIIRGEHAKPYYSNVVSDFLETIGWIKENAPPDAVVISDRPSWVYLLSGRKTFSFPWVPNTEEVIGFIRDIKADYAIVNPISGVTTSYLVPAIERYREGFKELFRKGDSIIYRSNFRASNEAAR